MADSPGAVQDILTFLIPLRHQANAKDWGLLKRNLEQTLSSIANQTDPRWRGVIVANYGADLPPLPDKFSVIWVDFEPNPLHDIKTAELEAVYEAFRFDKGRRVLAGALEALATEYLMIVDDDDFVSRKLTAFVATKSGASGWYIKHGWIWFDGGRLLYRHDSFSHLCGTSHIVRSDLYGFPSSFDLASQEYIKKTLGSHRFIESIVAEKAEPLVSLPFPGAVYRTGHSTAHSQSKGLLSTYFERWLLKRPLELMRRLSRLRYLTPSLRREFFGSA